MSPLEAVFLPLEAVSPPLAPMVDDRAAKMRKLFGTSALHKNTAVLAKTLAALRGLSDDELQDILGTDRHMLQRGVHEVWHAIRVDIEVPLVAGGARSLCMASWSKALQYFVSESANYRDLMHQLWKTRPCSEDNPYTLLVYADETIPGNVLNLQYPRKSFVVSCAVKEWGPTLLTNGALWMPLLCVRSNACKSIAGGAAAVWSAMLRQMLLIEKISTHGIPVSFGLGDDATLFFRVGNFLLDGDAIRLVYGSKGGRPKLPCIGCLNVTSDTNVVGSGMVSLRCADPSLFDFATDEDLWQKADLLEAARSGERKRLATSLGMNFVPQGFLWCKPLRPLVSPASCLTYDAMHVIYVNGIADDEYTNIMPRLLAAGVTWEHLRDYFRSAWCHARVFAGRNALSTAFGPGTEQHFSSSGSCTFTASQHLCIMPIFLHFLETVAAQMCPGRLEKEISSFRALSAMSFLVRHGKSSPLSGHPTAASGHSTAASGNSTAARLRDACSAWAQASARAYPDDARQSHKAHWLHHIPMQLVRDGFVLDCFVGERNQSMFKEAVRTIANTSAFESSVMARVLSRCLAHVEIPHAFQDHLLKPQACMELGGLSALAMKFGGTLFAKDDIIVHRESFYCIVACALVGNQYHFLVRALEVLGQRTPSSYRCAQIPTVTCIAAELEDYHATAWHWNAEEAMILL